MKAYVQRIKLDGFVRAGPNCEKYPDPYEQISAFIEHAGGLVEIVGLRSKCPHCGKGSLRPQHVTAAEEAFQKLGLSMAWDRANHKPRRITMRRERQSRPKGRKTPHPDEARKPDGTIDINIARVHAQEAFAALDAGEYEVVDIDEIEIAGTDLEQLIFTRRRLKK